MLIKQAETTF